MIFTYNSFLVEPSYCDLTVKCRAVSPVNANVPCQNLDNNGQLSWNFTPEDYTNRRVAPGSYTFTYDVTTSEGDADLTESFDVVVTLIDPCANLIVTIPDSQTVEYTITDLAKTLILDSQASVQRSDVCQLDSDTTTSTDSGLEDNVVYDDENQTITIVQITDTLAPSNPNNDGSTSAVATITTTYTTTDYNGNTSTTEVTHTVIIKNPCVDPDFVTIQAPNDFLLQEYIIDSGLKDLNAHDMFTVETYPVISHSLCGPITLTPKYDGALLPSSDPLTIVTYNSGV